MGKREMTRRAVFLDRDGVLNRVIVREDRPYPPASVEEFELYEDALAGCERLKNAGFLLVVASNQPDVGRGTQSRLIAEAINNKLLQLIPFLDRIEVCFHAGEGHGENCNCRKPKPGMLFHAAELMNIDLANSYMIGDRWRDVDCAKAAGCRAIFIDRGYREVLREQPDVTAKNFAEAVAAVLSRA
jgi:D-glycero-D-manno-heptose 1,7-bisphosphate phosphatase